jgi:hypothetical protein
VKVEAVTVCVNYSDFLAHTLPHNKNFFNNYVIVTSPDDIKTQKLCEYYYVKCVVTDAFYRDGATFNKAAGINEGLAALDCDDWVLHLDSDIYLPPFTRWFLELGNCDPRCLYGIDRQMCKSFEQWAKYLGDPFQYSKLTFIHADRFPLGTRLARGDEGYLPIGYFQLWNPKWSRIKHYPAEIGTVDHTDVQFARLWQPQMRRLIAEIVAIHLESEDAHWGANWKGRKTREFGPREVR